MEKGKKDKYEKPVLKKMDLTADETLAVGCKTTTSGGKAMPCISGMIKCSGTGS
ncbi:MAG: hypothetical protein WAV13_10980 [Thermodesulfovibrionales bacterium]